MTLAERDTDELRAAIAEAREQGDLVRLRTLVEGLEASLRWAPQDYQRPPEGDWSIWVARWGRGAGKSDTGAWWMDQHMTGPPCDARVPGGHRGLIVGPTFDSAVAACVQEPSGVKAHNPGVTFGTRAGGSTVRWPNGAEAVVLGAHTRQDSERLRGLAGNRCCYWLDEAAVMTHLTVALDNVVLGARLGPRARGIVTSTPKPVPAYTRLLSLPGVAQTVASTYDNRHLPAAYRAVIGQYEGTRLGRQELYAEVLADFEGALWRREWLDADRLLTYPDVLADRVRELGLTRVVVGVDPSTWDPDLGDDPGTVGEGVETGIVVAGIDASPKPEVFVLADESMRGSGEAWGRRTAATYHAWGANSVVPEVNLGGLVLTTLRLVDSTVSLHRRGDRVGVRAAQGKRARAEPVATLYEQHRVHHVGVFPELEAQLCAWDPRESWSPDRLDALVWAVTALEPWVPRGGTATSVASMAALGRRR